MSSKILEFFPLAFLSKLVILEYYWEMNGYFKACEKSPVILQDLHRGRWQRKGGKA